MEAFFSAIPFKSFAQKKKEEDEPQTVTNHIFQQLVRILTCLSSWRFHP